MAVLGLVFALFTVGYILGVWTACLVFKQPQRAYEEGGTSARSSALVMVARDAPPLAARRP